MQTPFKIILVWFIICHHSFTKLINKPKFIPYCTTKDRCKLDCDCEVSPNCTVLPMNDKVRILVAALHNQIRQIQSLGEPTPAGMTMLKYDTDLEEISDCWAARCDFEYSECFVTSQFNETSQWSVSLPFFDLESEGTEDLPFTEYWSEAISTVVGKDSAISTEIVNDFPGGQLGHELHNYAHLVTDRTRSVGCAWRRRRFDFTFVCTYGPRGPHQGEPIFKIGKRCSHCPENYACDGMMPFAKLCKEIFDNSTTILQTPPGPPPMPPQSTDIQTTVFQTPPRPPQRPPQITDSWTFLKSIPVPPPTPPQAQQLTMFNFPERPFSIPYALPCPQWPPNLPCTHSDNKKITPPRIPLLPPKSESARVLRPLTLPPPFIQQLQTPAFIVPQSLQPPPQLPLLPPTPPPLPRVPTEQFKPPPSPSNRLLHTPLPLPQLPRPLPTQPYPFYHETQQVFARPFFQPTPPPRMTYLELQKGPSNPVQ